MSMDPEDTGDGHGGWEVWVLFLSSGYHKGLLDSKVTPREVNAQW